MGLPQIIIELQHKASTLIQRSSRGIVLLILKDGTQPDKTRAVYTSPYDSDLTTANWTADNLDYIQKAFLGNPAAVICERMVEVEVTGNEEDTSDTISSVLARLSTVNFNYLAMPEAETAEVTEIVTWIKAQRAAKHYVKAVVTNSAADDYGIINFTTEGIMVGYTSYSTAGYTARIAGILAGLSLERSATYYVLDEVTAITDKTNPDTAVDGGELILINDGAKIKIGRAVNSKTTIGSDEIADMKKIKIIDAIDMIREDIGSTFADNYVGKVGNSYDNKVLFCAAVNDYFKDLMSEGVLYDQFDNKVVVDIAAQEKYIKEHGIDTSEMSEEEIKNANTGSKVFISGDIQFQDAMEDLTLTITI